MAPTTTSNRLLSLEQVRHLIPYSASQIYRLEKGNEFPHRLSIGPNRVAWIKEEIDRWLEDRVAERNSKLAERLTSETKTNDNEQMRAVEDSKAPSDPSELADHRCDHG
jgi:predicted DNA-binding transcriptional regulator AlpA